jgi:transcription-repair coupling factor (superfamily II helicase)
MICKYYVYDKLLVPIFKKIGIIYTPEPPKYSEELTLEIVKRYKFGETLEEIATAVDKTPNSIRGKLVSEKVDTEYKEVNFRLSQMTNAEIEPLNFTEGMEFSFEDAVQYLNEAGYIRVSQVNEEGYYSVKGGIIKVHPFGSEVAITLDYFGDTIEAIKAINKRGKLASVSISPYPLGVTYSDVQSRLDQLNQLKDAGLIDREEVTEKSRATLNSLNK